jgi:hypothetical protein
MPRITVMASEPINVQNFSSTPVHRSEIEAAQTDNGTGAALATGISFAAQLASKAAAASPYGALPGLASSLLSGVGNAGGLSLAGIQGDIANSQNQFLEMLRIQNQMQLQNQTFTTITNVSKMDHESRMAAVRNIRA